MFELLQALGRLEAHYTLFKKIYIVYNYLVFKGNYWKDSATNAGNSEMFH